MISNIKGARTPSKKWKYSATKAEKEKKYKKTKGQHQILWYLLFAQQLNLQSNIFCQLVSYKGNLGGDDIIVQKWPKDQMIQILASKDN